MSSNGDGSTGSQGDVSPRILDFGGHFYTNRVPFRPDRWDRFDDLVGPAFSDPEALLGVYREAGIDGTVLVAPLYVQRTDAEHVARANDILLDIAQSHDGFVGALASIPFNEAGETAAAEFERCLDAGFGGAVIETVNDDGVELVDREVEPILEVADRTGAPLMVHPRARQTLLPGVDVLDETYRHDSTFGREVTLLDSLCKVIHEGVLDRYGNLNLVYDHVGGNVAAFLGRLEYQLDPDRWPGTTDRIEPWPEFRSQLEDRIYLKLSGYFGRPAPVRTALEEFPSSQILFGTDFPIEVRDAAELRRCVAAVEDYTSRADARRIFSENTLELLVGTT